MNHCIRIFVLGLLVSPAAVFAAGGGYGSDRLETSAPRMSPEDMGASAYNDGLKQRDKAWEFEQEAKALADSKKKDKLLQKAEKAYLKAAKQFEKAVKHHPRLYQAWSALGHSRRKTGSFDESLAAYEKALTLNSDYHEAIEYQAEAFMQLHRYAQVKAAYERLATEHLEYARKLLQAIDEWLPTQGMNGNAELQAFAEWAGRQK
jgi:Tfp pilus assembly protein PilF